MPFYWGYIFVAGLMGWIILNPKTAQAAFGNIGSLGIPDISFNLDNGGGFSVGLDTTSTDIDTLARTAWGEDRGGGTRGMQAVINTIMNRYALAQQSTAYGQQFGYSITEICKKRAQFSVWNANDPNFGPMQQVDTSNPDFVTAMELATLAVSGQLADVTGGALYYRGIGASLPANTTVIASIGGNIFFNYD